MNPTTDLSILTLVQQASPVVQAILAILVLLSLLSWTVIFQKAFAISRAARQTEDFEARFWGGSDMTKLLETAKKPDAGIEERLFAAGMTEFTKQQKAGGDVTSGVTRAMRAVFTREMDGLEKGLPLLASIGSTSPYVGLFGTVWGIMNAFTGLSTLDNVSLAVVAPGIAEALVSSPPFRPWPPTTTSTTASTASPTASRASARSSSTFSNARRGAESCCAATAADAGS